MQSLWTKIFMLGTNKLDELYKVKYQILSNRINTYVLLCMIFILALDNIIHLGLFQFRLYLLVIVCVINIFLAYKGYYKLMRLNLIFLPGAIFILLSSVLGFVHDKYFFYYHTIIIAFSTLSHLLLEIEKEKFLYIISLAYFFVMLIIADNLLIWFGPPDLKVPGIIKEFYLYFKIIPILLFLFISFNFYYIRKLIYNFEQKYVENNNELRVAIKKLRQAQMQLVQKEKMASLGTLIAGIAHELNNPLNHISGGVQLINQFNANNDKYLPYEKRAEIKETLSILDAGVEATSQIIDSLKTFSYKGLAAKTEVNINTILDSTLQFLSSKIQDDVEIQKRYNFQNQIKIFAGKMHQVFLNILDNSLFAIKDNNGRKLIRISTYEFDLNLVVEIFNNGSSIPEEILNKLYDPFFTTKNPGEGTGLGLAISYSIIEKHKGRILAENTKGGVKFTISIPM